MYILWNFDADAIQLSPSLSPAGEPGPMGHAQGCKSFQR